VKNEKLKGKSDEEGNVETVAADYHHDTDSY